jgi:hypothetical protein
MLGCTLICLSLVSDLGLRPDYIEDTYDIAEFNNLLPFHKGDPALPQIILWALDPKDGLVHAHDFLIIGSHISPSMSVARRVHGQPGYVIVFFDRRAQVFRRIHISSVKYSQSTWDPERTDVEYYPRVIRRPITDPPKHYAPKALHSVLR